MKIKIIAVGNLKENFLKDAALEYRKRIGKFAKIEVVEVIEERFSDKASEKNILECLDKEAENIVKHIDRDDYVIELAIEGKSISSPELAEKIQQITVAGSSSIAFIIGSSYGLSEKIRQRANFSLSFSKMTFPHQLMRVILLEQIFRAFKINANESYHK